MVPVTSHFEDGERGVELRDVSRIGRDYGRSQPAGEHGDVRVRHVGRGRLAQQLAHQLGVLMMQRRLGDPGVAERPANWTWRVPFRQTCASTTEGSTISMLCAAATLKRAATFTSPRS